MKKNINKLATLALTGILMTGMSFGSLAAATLNGGAVTSTDTTLQIVKELGVTDIDSDYVPTAPKVNFTYSIAAATDGQLGTVTETDETPRKSGVAADKVTVGDASFLTTDEVTDKKALKNVTIDFSAITEDDWKVNGAGVYRYVLTEDNSYKVDDGYDYADAMQNNAMTTRYIDVYVGYNEDGKLGIVGYVVRKTDTDEGKTGGYEVEKKTIEGSEVTTGSVYKTYDLKVNKHVTGTLGDKNKDFNFTTTVVVPTGATYGYEETNNTQKESIEDTETSVASGLKDSEYFEIKGVPVGQELTVTEDNYSREGYKTYVAVDSENYGETEKREETQKENRMTGATVLNFKNAKNDTTPTGVVMNVAPYAAMILGAGAFAGVFLGRKKSEDEE